MEENNIDENPYQDDEEADEQDYEHVDEQNDEQDDELARLTVARKAKRHYKFAIAGFVLTGLSLVTLLSNMEKQSAQRSFDEVVGIICAAVSSFASLRYSRKLALMALQEGPLVDTSKNFNYDRIAAGGALGILLVLVLHSPWPIDIQVISVTTVINILVVASFYFRSEEVVGLKGRIVIGCILCVIVFWNAGRKIDAVLQVVISGYLIFLATGEPTRKRWKIGTFVAAPLCSIILVAGQDYSKFDKNSYNSKLEACNTQLVKVAAAINWKDAASIRKGIYAMQKIEDDRAPYLDSLIFRIKTSLDLLHPKDTVRAFDTLNLIAWHRVLLQNLKEGAKQREILDTLCDLITFQQYTTDSLPLLKYRDQINQWYAKLLQSDSIQSATHVVEARYRTQIGEMEMPY